MMIGLDWQWRRVAFRAVIRVSRISQKRNYQIAKTIVSCNLLKWLLIFGINASKKSEHHTLISLFPALQTLHLLGLYVCVWKWTIIYLLCTPFNVLEQTEAVMMLLRCKITSKQWQPNCYTWIVRFDVYTCHNQQQHTQAHPDTSKHIDHADIKNICIFLCGSIF